MVPVKPSRRTILSFRDKMGNVVLPKEAAKSPCPSQIFLPDSAPGQPDQRSALCMLCAFTEGPLMALGEIVEGTAHSLFL